MSTDFQPSPTGQNKRLEAMLRGPIVITLLALSWPNILMMFAQSSTGLIETWFLSRLGTDALAGAALVVPVLMLMQNMSQGAMGGGISSAIARALGAGKVSEANQLVLQAVFLNALLGLIFSVVLFAVGPIVYVLMGGQAGALTAALEYSNVISIGLVLLWTMNALASAVRGTGNMVVPGAVICGGTLLLLPLSPALIFGFGPLPALGMAGAGWAMVIYYGAGVLVLAWYFLSGRSTLRLPSGKPSWALMRRILSVGALATLNPLLSNTLIATTTTLVGAYAGTAALAGYGTASRIEYLVIPIAFGIGAPLVAMVGSNIGAGQPQRALRIATIGAAIAFVLSEAIGLTAAAWPSGWMNLFSADEHTLDAGSAFLRHVGPFLGFFGAGFTLYFAAQGAGRMKWPLLAGAARLIVAGGGGWALLHSGGSLNSLFMAGAAGMVVYGLVSVCAIAFGGKYLTQEATVTTRLIKENA